MLCSSDLLLLLDREWKEGFRVTRTFLGWVAMEKGMGRERVEDGREE